MFMRRHRHNFIVTSALPGSETHDGRPVMHGFFYLSKGEVGLIKRMATIILDEQKCKIGENKP